MPETTNTLNPQQPQTTARLSGEVTGCAAVAQVSLFPRKIALHDHEQNGYPNLALMKLSAWHKAQGDSVEWFSRLATYDVVYSAKIFTWTPPDPYLPATTVRGGTGFDVGATLPDEVENMLPDYGIYNCGKSYGFLTRGCIRSCPWCFVPKKEGMIRAHHDIEAFARHPEVVLMDNNVLAHPHGIAQIEKIARLGLKVDFNQGLDARLIDDGIARLLGKVKWSPCVRLACDSAGMIEPVRKAVELLRWHNVTPARYFCYVLVKDVPEAAERVRALKGMYVDPFCQPYRDMDGTEPTHEQRRFARWCNQRAINKTIPWEDYKAA